MQSNHTALQIKVFFATIFIGIFLIWLFNIFPVLLTIVVFSCSGLFGLLIVFAFAKAGIDTYGPIFRYYQDRDRD